MTKSIVTGLLAFAVSSSLVLAQDPAAAGGWSAKPGYGIKYDGGDTFTFNLANQLHQQWAYTANEIAPDTNTFTINRARTTMWGNVFHKNVLYVLRLDAVDAGPAGDGNLKDGHVTWNFVNGDSTIGLRMGQGKVLYGLEGTGSSSGLFFTNRSSAARAFSNNRSRGAWLVGSGAENKLRWSVGAMNGDVAGGLGAGYIDAGEETANSDNELSFTAMVNFDPMGDILGGKGPESWRQGDFRTDDKKLMGTVGLGVAQGNGKSALTGTDVESRSINVNTAWSVEGFQVMGEFFFRTDDQQGAAADEEEPHAWAISGTYVMPKTGDTGIQWGFGARINAGETDVGTTGSGVNFVTGMQGIGGANGEVKEITLVADAFYHAHAAKTQIEYTFQDVDVAGGGAGDATNHIITVAFQLLF